ncbi:MAG: methionine biosynthesis protein MetW [Patescibacteria group bacterium]
MHVKQFENNRWQREDQTIQFRHKATLSMIDSGTVLDLGSGDGLLLVLLHERGVIGKGFDLSEEGVIKANKKGLDTKVFDFSSNKLPFPDNSFDTVVMLDILEHLYDPQFLLSEARRVSRKNIIVGVPNFSSLPARLQTLIGHVPENNQPKKGHVYWFNLPVLLTFFSRTGLSLVKLQSNTVFESIPLVSTITKFLARAMPNLFSLSFVALARK